MNGYTSVGPGDVVRLLDGDETGVVDQARISERDPSRDTYLVRMNDGHTRKVTGADIDLVHRLHMPPIVCFEWCVEGDGHGDAHHQDDQVCRSKADLLSTRLEPKWSSGASWNENVMEVFREAGPTTPHRVVLYGGPGHEFQINLTRAEALQLADALRAHAELPD